MTGYSCKCGESKFFGSGMYPKECQGCDKCNTNYVGDPIAPHKLEIRYSRKTGNPNSKECAVCLEGFPLEDK